MTEDWMTEIKKIVEERKLKFSVEDEILLADFVRDTKERMIKESLK